MYGAMGLMSQYQFGTVSAVEGESAIQPVVPTGGGQTNITIANLVRSSTSTATIDFNVANNDTRARILLTQLNGQAPALTNGILGGWAVEADRFATYVPGVGVAGR